MSKLGSEEAKLLLVLKSLKAEFDRTDVGYHADTEIINEFCKFVAKELTKLEER